MSKNPQIAQRVALERGMFDPYRVAAESSLAKKCAFEKRWRETRLEYPAADEQAVRMRAGLTTRLKGTKVSLPETRFGKASEGGQGDGRS